MTICDVVNSFIKLHNCNFKYIEFSRQKVQPVKISMIKSLIAMVKLRRKQQFVKENKKKHARDSTSCKNTARN